VTSYIHLRAARWLHETCYEQQSRPNNLLLFFVKLPQTLPT
jgi:hypothetical protein